jgi:hypothetical protein
MGVWLRKRSPDVLLVFGVWVFIGFLNGSEPWVSLDTPDSEFHASMAIFGSEVTDRAALPVYYWTRLGQIAPSHLLTEIFGPITGLEVYRLLLLAVIVVAVFITLRHFTDRFNATLLTLLVGSNTVVLGYLGNPYPTATAMAAIFVLIAVGITSRNWAGHAVAGGALAWLVMTSPFGALLGAVAYLSALLSRERWVFQPRRLLTWAATVTVGAASTFFALLLAGRLLFPDLDWLGTYLYWNSALNQADYIFNTWQWTWDPSMLVPAMVSLIGLIAIANRPRLQGVRVGAVIALATPVFAVIYWWLSPNNYLEIPHYQAMLFPAALTALAVIAASRLPVVGMNWLRSAFAVALVGLTILAGHSTPELSVWQARALALLALVVFLIPWGTRWIAVAMAVTVTFAGAQLLQNARGNFGVSTTRLYANAYLSNETKMMMTSAADAEEWVISQTKSGDRVLTWVDADWASGEQALLPLAAFQLWGANEAAKGPRLTPEGAVTLQARKPLSLVMYGKSMGSVVEFWDSLPSQWRASPPECKHVSWPQTITAEVCVTHLTW